jgi:hypothetical protein
MLLVVSDLIYYIALMQFVPNVNKTFLELDEFFASSFGSSEEVASFL